ncbi:putative DD41D transposase [Trichonephila clavipes]|nr:putative DD41D transposase [Trichonephila clavipes]
MVDFHKRILFSDEAHFWLNGYVNKQTCRIWSEANPQGYVETPLHPETLTVWCALWAGGIIGPYFFKNDEGHNVTVNGDRYRAMMTNFFIPELNNQDVQELWFQQDGATCHTAHATIDLLKDMFGDRLISRFGPVNWPPRSCDLTSLDYFLWGYVKSLVYADKPQTLDHLEDNIRRVIAEIRPEMLEKVIENWTSRLDYIRASRGSLMPEIIFKILTPTLRGPVRHGRPYRQLDYHRHSSQGCQSTHAPPAHQAKDTNGGAKDNPNLSHTIHFHFSLSFHNYHISIEWSDYCIGSSLQKILTKCECLSPSYCKTIGELLATYLKILNYDQVTRTTFELVPHSPNGYVNKQNCRIWSEANPQVYVETPLHPETLTVWCALWAGGILLQKR